MTFKKIIGTALAVSMVTPLAMAEEQDFDASDMTRASSTAIVGLSNKGDVKLTGSLSYAFDNGQTAMTLLEGTMDRDGAYQDARLQYFHVFSFDNATTPRIAASLDIIDNDMFTSAALGGIAMIRTPADSLTFFARGAVLAGEYDEDFARSYGVDDSSITGGSAALYAVWKTGEDGTFLAAYPELTYLGGDLEVSTVKTTLMVSTPFSADGKRWGQVKFDTTTGSIESSSKKTEMDSETSVWFNYKVFF
ncbi:hypothetical protein [Psychromonas ossibalaenae]|uniref:hypothetical protein n=1 Tax=Psychromonas ossibalaenae TaxID=444922 RepID=UPI00035CA723|nr:hypothetical protein [Psychromonas ossibalaenae]